MSLHFCTSQILSVTIFPILLRPTASPTKHLLMHTVIVSKGFFPKDGLSILELTYAEFVITHFYARQWPLNWTSWTGAGTLFASN